MRNTDHSILLADENDATRAFLTSNLEADGYRVKAADDRATAIALLSVDQPDLIIADINGQTLELLDAIRSGNGLAGHLNPDTPMIVLSERPDHLHRIRVLERGGDDIIAKPFSYPELRARVAAVLRRAERSRHPRQLRVASLTIDLTARHVRLGDDPVALSAKEYELLVALAHDPHRVFTREELLLADVAPRTDCIRDDVDALPDGASLRRSVMLRCRQWSGLPRLNSVLWR